MAETRVAGGVLGFLVAVALLVVGGLFGYAGALAINVEESGLLVPPELEALYRQIGGRYEVPWAALAAWDAVENRFSLPIPLVSAIFDNHVHWELQRRLRVAAEWCEKLPDDEKRCPVEPPRLTPDEEVTIWEGAQVSWRSLRKSHIERHAVALQPHAALLERNPAAAFSRVMSDGAAIRAEELFEGYQILETLDHEQDVILVDAPSLPVGWKPVDGFAWPVVGSITSRYGMRYSPIDGQRRLHAGIDLAVPAGIRVGASKGGRVVRSEYDQTYGLVVVVDHGDGYRSLYAHASRLYVTVGQWPNQGDVVALAGSTGRSTGAHLHFEIHYRGVPVDPLLLLSQRL